MTFLLPSICKKEVRQPEVRMMRMKSRLMIKANFGLENYL